MTSEEIDDALRRKAKFEKMFKDKWDTLKIDAMIAPTSYHCAFRHKEQFELSFSNDYFGLWNILEYPAGVVPVTEVLEGEDKVYDDGFND